MTAEQRIKWECLRLDVIAACRPSRPSAEGLSRGAARVSEHIQENLLPLAVAGSEEHLARMTRAVARPIVSSRINLPERAAGNRPENFLSPSECHAFTHQEEWTLHPEPGGRPRSCNMISHEEEEKLRLRLLHCGAACLLPECDAPYDERSGQVIAAGFFCSGAFKPI